MGYVYFLQARSQSGQRIKIGRSQHCPQRRLRQLRGRYPQYQGLVMLGAIPTTAPCRDELAIHKRFRHLRERGEFYRSEKTLRDFIKRTAEIHICSAACFVRTLEEKERDERSAAFGEWLKRQMEENVAEYMARHRARLARERAAKRRQAAKGSSASSKPTKRTS